MPGAGVLDLLAQSCVVLSWGYSSSWAHQKGEQSRPFCAGAAPAWVLFPHTPAPHPQPTVPTGGHLASETEQGRRAPGKPAAGQPAGPWFTKTRPTLPGPLPLGSANFLFGQGS